MFGLKGKTWLIEAVVFFTVTIVVAESQGDPFETEFRQLYSSTEEKDALESIRALHQQLDDDNDGTIEPFETVDFIKSDLDFQGSKQGTSDRQKVFHNKDQEITVKDLWNIWKQSEVHNWNVDETIKWLETTVELPQYAYKFRANDVTGSKLPQIAMESNFLVKILAISNPIHRSKISLKAMDAVLFGPPRLFSNRSKEIVLTIALIVALAVMLIALRKHQISQQDIQKMGLDMKALLKAEETLRGLQAESSKNKSSLENGPSVEVSKLKEEVKVLRSELHRAEEELEDRPWVAPPLLQTWLQLIYETGVQQYNSKKKAAILELEDIRFMCEKISHKRLSLIGAFISTHAGSIYEAERMIADSKAKFDKLAKEYTEMNRRWKAVESLCSCDIMQNPGLDILQSLTSNKPLPRFSIGNSLHASQTYFEGSLENSFGVDDNTDTLSTSTSSPKLIDGHQTRKKKESLAENVVENVINTLPVPAKDSSNLSEQIHLLTAKARLNADFHVHQDDEELQRHPNDQTLEPRDEASQQTDLSFKNGSSKSSSAASLPSLHFNTSRSSISLAIPEAPPRFFSQTNLARNSTTGDSTSASLASEAGVAGKTPPKKPKRKGIFSFGRKKSTPK